MQGLEAIFRWMHVFVGIIWIGHLYFFNWVNGAMAAQLDGPTKKAVVPELMPRALYWFRWGAAWTWITGVLLLMLVYYHGQQTFQATASWSSGAIVMIAITFLSVFAYDILWKSMSGRPAFIVSFVILSVIVAMYHYVGAFGYRGLLIHTGALFGTAMAYNVWFRIWPAQQQIIRAVKNGDAPNGDLVKLAGLRSKHNTYMSLPLIWAMIGQHTTFFGGGNLGIPSDYYWVAWLAIIALGWHIIFQCYRKSGKVKGF